MSNDAPETGRSSVDRVRQALAELGLETEIKQFAAWTRTSADAAAAIGCSVAQIAKSLVFRAKPSGRAILVMASGANRVDEKKLAAALNESMPGATIAKADADFVRAETGFAIGGVSPVGHGLKVKTFIDRDLMDLGEIWAAAGSPNSVFRLTPQDLLRVTQGQIVALKL